MQGEKVNPKFEQNEILKETIGIRVDMNPVIATGHIMRCLSIADAVVELGKKVIFISADAYPAELIKQRGHELIVLGTNWQNMEEELPLLQKWICECNISKMLVDSYQVTAGYLQNLKEWAQITYIDDLDSFAYPVEQLVCYANYYNSFSYGKKEERDGYYLGMKYVPLRRAFQNCPAKTISERVRKVLLLSGGSDSCGILERMADVFKDKTDIVLTVICGSFYPDFERLTDKYKEYGNLVFCKNVSNIEEYMKNADFAISAGGTTLYELCAVGTPTISYSFVDNQLYTVEQFDKDGLIEYAGDVRKEDIFGRVAELFGKYDSDKYLREERSIKMQQMVDGNGAKRIAKAIV